MPFRNSTVETPCVELYTHRVNVQQTQIDRNFEPMLTCRRPYLRLAKRNVRPMPLQSELPSSDFDRLCAVLSRPLAIACRSRHILLLNIFSHGTCARILRGQLRHTVPHSGHPRGGHSIRIAAVELRDDFLFHQGVQCVGLFRIPCGIVAVFKAIAQRPADFGAVRLRPPAIQFR